MKSKLKKRILVSFIFLFCSCNKGTSNNSKIINEIPYEPVMKGYITNFNVKSRTFDFDEIEWITLIDEDRIKELGIENDMPGGFYIFNPDMNVRTYILAENAEFYVIIGADHTTVNILGFVENFHDYAPYIIDIIDGKVIRMTEQYLP